MSAQPWLFPLSQSPWAQVRDGNDTARSIFDRHYSRYHYKDGRKPKLFVGPGEKMVLVTWCARAVFVWRKFKSADLAGQTGVNCAVFRNEGAGLSSALILEAMRHAWLRWPGERLYTYVSDKVASSNPGYCFIRAGWGYVRDGTGRRMRTKVRKLLIMEALPPAAFSEVRV